MDKDKYEPEAWTTGPWSVQHFNDRYWEINGPIKTPSDGFIREEVVGVASELYAQGIADAHNTVVNELQSQVTRLRELCGEIWVSIPDHVSYYDWCALKKRYEQCLKDEGVVK